MKIIEYISGYSMLRKQTINWLEFLEIFSMTFRKWRFIPQGIFLGISKKEAFENLFECSSEIKKSCGNFQEFFQDYKISSLEKGKLTNYF